MLVGNKNSVWVKEVVEPTIYDDATVIYSLRNYFNWSDAILKVRRSSDNAVKWVFFDSLTITLNSLVGDDRTTPTVTTLGTWIGVYDGFVEEWIGQKSDNIINLNYIATNTLTTEQPQIISSGAIITKGSLPSIDFLSSNRRLINVGVITALATENEFTSLTVSSVNNLSGLGVVFASNNVGTYRFTSYADASTNKVNSLIQTSLGTTLNTTLIQYNNTNQRINTTVKKYSPNTINGYYNGVVQNTGDVWSGTYLNEKLQIGAQFTGSLFLNGKIQEIIIFPSDKTADLTDLHTDLNTYYSIY